MKSTMLLSGNGYSGIESMFFNFSLCVLHFACHFAELLTVCTLSLFCRRRRCCCCCWWWWFSEKIQSAPNGCPSKYVCMHACCTYESGCACACMSEWMWILCSVSGVDRVYFLCLSHGACVSLTFARWFPLIPTQTHIHAASEWVSEWVSESMKGAFHHLYAVFAMENMKMLTCAVNTWAHDENEWRQWRQATGLRVVYVFYYDVIFFILLVCDWVLCS